MFLGVDCGTQGTKALIVSPAGAALGRGHAAHALIGRPDGAREQEPLWWVEALTASVRQAVAEAGSGRVLAMGVSGQQHGLVVLDKEMQVIRPAKLWNDTETAPENAEIVRRLGGAERCVERFGIVPLTGYTVSKLLWLRQHEPANFARIRHILLPHEYLNFYLTGRVAAEAGDASGTAFFDVRSRAWATEVLAEIDGGTGQLAAALPPLLPPDALVGDLLPEVAEALGIDPGCAISAGGGDNMMAAIGTGNVRPGVVTLSLGTSSTVFCASDRPAPVVHDGLANFCSSAGGWLPLVCTMNATNVVTATLDLLGRTVAEIEPMLEETKPGAGGLTFLPFLNGERTPDLPEARGTLLGISATNYTAANLLRATIEGVTFGIAGGIDLVYGPGTPERIVLVGGGARSPGWRQMIADLTGSVVEVPREPESGCLGAAIQAIYAYGKQQGDGETIEAIAGRLVAFDAQKAVQPDHTRHAAYARAFGLYRERLRSLYGIPATPLEPIP